MVHTTGLPGHGLEHAPRWLLYAVILFVLAIAATQWLDGPSDIEAARDVAQDAAAAPKAVAANLDEAIKLACHTHGAKGRVNRFGDIQCFKDGKPTYYVHVARVQP
jgi:hypothetical protein